MLFKKEGIMMNENGYKTKEGYIYIYKCTQSTDKQDICKIGKTIHFKDELDRIKQHNRTPFHGFTPYIDFDTNQTIITVFKVNDATGADTVVKEAFNEFSMFETELYGVDYVDAIEKLYNLLKDNYYLLGIFRDGHTSVFKRLGVKYNSNLIIDGYGDYEDGTDKKDFQNLIKEIDNKYLGDYKDILEDKEMKKHIMKFEDFKVRRYTHYVSGNYVNFKYKDYILDIHCDSAKRWKIKEKLSGYLK